MEKVLEEILKEYLSEKRLNHVIRVSKKALELSKYYNKSDIFIKKAIIGGYLHDICKEFNINELIELVSNKYEEIKEEDKVNSILHGFAAAEYILKNKKKFNFISDYIDEDLLNSLRYHTIGRENMSDLEKIIYLSDAIEDGRNFKGVEEIRKLSLESIDKAILKELDIKINSLIDRKLPIHINTIKLRNELVNRGYYE